MSEDLEAVLRQVAAGELTPEQALQLLGDPTLNRPTTPEPGTQIRGSTDETTSTGRSSQASLTDQAGSTEPTRRSEPTHQSGPTHQPGPTGWAGWTDRVGSTDETSPTSRTDAVDPPQEPVTTIRLKTSYRSIQLIADPAVAQIHVLGEHSIRHEGPALIIATAGPLDNDNEDDERPDLARNFGHFSFSHLPRTIAWARSWREHQLTVRINPALRLELDVTGADVKATGFEAGLSARVVASSLRADKLHGTLDVDALSSSVKLTGIPTGDCRIMCESSSVRLSLAVGSDLKITATNRMGRLVLPDLPPSTLSFEGESSETTIGDGHDRLTLDAVMSSVTVNAQAWGEVPA